MLGVRRRPKVETERMTLRLPQHPDWRAWSSLREASAAHLTPWEPVWSEGHLSRRSFAARVYWAIRAEAQGTATKAIEDALTEAREDAGRWKGAQAFQGTEDERTSLSGMSDAAA